LISQKLQAMIVLDVCLRPAFQNAAGLAEARSGTDRANVASWDFPISPKKLFEISKKSAEVPQKRPADDIYSVNTQLSQQVPTTKAVFLNKYA